MGENGSIPMELGWTVLVLIPKGNADTRGIRLLGVIWKVVEAVIDTRIKTVAKFYDVLHEFHIGRGREDAIMELKLTQEFESVDKAPLLLVLMDLSKA